MYNSASLRDLRLTPLYSLVKHYGIISIHYRTCPGLCLLLHRFLLIIQDLPLLKIYIYLFLLKRKLYGNLFDYMCLQTSSQHHRYLTDRRHVRT